MLTVVVVALTPRANLFWVTVEGLEIITVTRLRSFLIELFANSIQDFSSANFANQISVGPQN